MLGLTEERDWVSGEARKKKRGGGRMMLCKDQTSGDDKCVQELIRECVACF